MTTETTSTTADELAEAPGLVRPGMTPAERCLYIADLIERHPANFNMEVYFDAPDTGPFPDRAELYDMAMSGERWNHLGCGTTQCIAGWAIAVTPAIEVSIVGIECTSLPKQTDQQRRVPDIDEVAVRLLGLPGDELFFEMALTPEEAADRLRAHARALGES